MKIQSKPDGNVLMELTADEVSMICGVGIIGLQALDPKDVRPCDGEHLHLIIKEDPYQIGLRAFLNMSDIGIQFTPEHKIVQHMSSRHEVMRSMLETLGRHMQSFTRKNLNELLLKLKEALDAKE